MMMGRRNVNMICWGTDRAYSSDMTAHMVVRSMDGLLHILLGSKILLLTQSDCLPSTYGQVDIHMFKCTHLAQLSDEPAPTQDVNRDISQD